MKKIFTIFIFAKLLLILFIANSYAATGAASVYKVTMTKLEFCKGSSGFDSCDNSVVVGSGEKEVDIASVSAGAAAASYGDPVLLPLGQTYTHVRVTILRKFTIKTKTAIDTGGAADNCVSQAVGDTQYGGSGKQAARKFTHSPTVADDGTAANQVVYLTNDSYTLCTNNTCGTSSASTNDYGAPKSAQYQEGHNADTGTEHVLVYKLTTPYTVSLVAPQVDISFGTQKAIGAYNVGGRCLISAEEPVVTVTIE